MTNRLSASMTCTVSLSTLANQMIAKGYRREATAAVITVNAGNVAVAQRMQNFYDCSDANLQDRIVYEIVDLCGGRDAVYKGK